MATHQAFVLLGSNQGNREQFLQQATELMIRHCGRLEKKSAVYETAAWGKEDQPSFLNQVVVLRTTFSPDVLMSTLLEIEQELGRIRTEKLGPRTIDLDLLFYDQLVHQSAIVTIPHPSIPLRRFVLIPLAELAPLKVHPVLKKTIRTLLKECADPLPVTKR